MSNSQKPGTEINQEVQKIEKPVTETLPGTKPRISGLTSWFEPITSWLYQELCRKQ